MSAWVTIDPAVPVNTSAAPFDGERVMLWMHPETGFTSVFGCYEVRPMWGPCWTFEGECSVEAPAGALYWRPVPLSPTESSD